MTRAPSLNIIRGVLLITTCLVGSSALAGSGPSGGDVVSGRAHIGHPNPNRTVVHQSTDKALINWDSFSIPSGSTVVFKQPNQGSITVNRVVGPSASAIYGDLLANGQIWLINGNGILFGKGSQINVEGLIATTSDITNDDFKKGNYRFSAPSKNPDAAVVNVGTIRAGRDGSIVLSASAVANEGLIQANLGTVVLGGAKAFTVDMDGDNLIRYQISSAVTETPHDSSGAAVGALVSNSGTIKADGGRVLMTVRAARNVQDDIINNTGIVEATSVSSHNGEIDLEAGRNGTVDAGGTLDASGDNKGETGGTIRVAGQTVNIEKGARLDASGDSGGGTILVGGNFHGAGHMRQAHATYVARTATINVDAIRKGDGGRVAVWSNGNTYFAGRISAKGGALGGAGGFVETSGNHLGVGSHALVNTSARLGTVGQWLLDPNYAEIEAPADGNSDGDGYDYEITSSALATSLGLSNVTISATNEIFVESGLTYSSAHSLTLSSGGNIDVGGSIQNSGSGAINLSASGTVTIIGGYYAAGDVEVGSASGTTTVTAANLTVESYAGNAQLGYHGNGGGNIVVDLTGDLNVTVSNFNSGTGYAQIGNGDAFGNGGGLTNITGNITLQVAGATLLDQSNGGLTWIGNVANNSGVESGNVTLVTGTLNEVAVSGSPFDQMIAADLGTSSSTGGDFTLALTNTAVATPPSGIVYSSPHALSLLSTNGITVDYPIQNSGTGNLNIVGGWNTNVVSAANLIANGVSTVLTTPGAYGNNNGDVVIGGNSAAGNVAVGTKNGTTTVAGHNVTVEADNGTALLGYLGGGQGNVAVLAAGNVFVTASNGQLAWLGNYSNNSSDGNISGNLSIVGASLTVQGGGAGSRAQIGNHSAGTNSDAGNININVAGNLSDTASGLGSVAYIGNSCGCAGTGNIVIASGGNILLTSDAGATGGGTRIGNSGSGTITVTASGNITLDAVSSYALIGNLGTGTFGGNINVTSGGTVALDTGSDNTSAAIGNQEVGATSTISGNVTVNAQSVAENVNGLNSVAQIGNNGFNSTGDVVGGNVTVTTSGGPITLAALGQGSRAQIGDFGLANSTVTGDITVSSSGGALALSALDSGANAQIGNIGGLISSGNMTVNAGAISLAGQTTIGNSGASTDSGNVTISGQSLNGDIGSIMTSDLQGGNFTLALSGNSPVTIATAFDYSSGNTLSFSNGGAIIFDASVQNAGSGAINIHSNSDITIGGNGASGGVAVGSAGGLLTLSANNITLDASNGFAQLGFNGNGSGGIDVTASNDITLNGGNHTGYFAQIGNVSSGGAVSGDIQVNAGNTIVLNPASSAAQTGIGNIGASGSAGNVTIAAQSVTGDINPSLATDLQGGNFSLTLTGNSALDIGTLGTAANYSSAYTLSISNGGNIVIDAAIKNAGTGNLALTTTGAGSNIEIQNLVTTGGAVALNSGGTIAESGSGAVDAAALSGSSVGGTTLNGANQIATLDAFTNTGAGGFALTDAGSLAVNGAVDAGTGDLALTTTGAGSDIAFNAGVQTSGSADITIKSTGNILFAATVQNSGSGAVNVQSGGDVTIGGTSANGNVFVGSKSGQLTLTADNVVLDASNGFAQLGYHGSGSGNITVAASGNVTLLGGSAADYAQIGNGGYKTSGDESGDITVAAQGDVALDGGSGKEAYAQIGHGGAEANSSSAGYSNTGVITVSGHTVTLAAGNGASSYAQIGNGGYLVGQNLTGGTATNSGNITVNAVELISLTGGGDDAYAQIGNGGDQVNDNPDNSASGSNSGDIVVAVSNPNGAVTLAAGTGSNAYAQIGNGGFGNNMSSATNVNFTDSGNITVSDLSVTGSDTGNNSYAQVGNGDNAGSGHANVSGDITVSSNGTITVTNGAKGKALIGNATGQGTVSGTVTGYGSPPPPIDDSNSGAVASLIQINTNTQTNLVSFNASNTGTLLDTNGATEGDQANTSDNPLQALVGDNGNSEGTQESDGVTASIGQSLGHGGKKTVISQTLIPGVLRQTSLLGANQPRGVPPADQDYSSWGNEALWRW